MKDPFDIWYEESGHRFDHGKNKRDAMEIAFCRGEVVGMERAMGYAERRHNEDKNNVDCDTACDCRRVRGHQEQHMAD